MKKGHLYIVINNTFHIGRVGLESLNYHHYNIGDLVECTNGKTRDFTNENGLMQYVQENYVKLIGKI